MDINRLRRVSKLKGYFLDALEKANNEIKDLLYSDVTAVLTQLIYENVAIEVDFEDRDKKVAKDDILRNIRKIYTVRLQKEQETQPDLCELNGFQVMKEAGNYVCELYEKLGYTVI